MSRLRQHDHTLDGSEWDLSLLSLNEAPVEELKKNPRARKIDLSQNFMIKLPDSFTSLTHLIVLDLSKNRLQRLPDDFGNLTKLNRLDLYGNLLKTLPLTFGQLVKLRWLDLKQNPLEQPLAKTAGDCANQRQCEVCAINCVKFMRAEKLRVEVELRDRDVKMKQKLDYERRLQEKNLKEKERKKAKKARSTARKAQQKLDQDSEEDDEETDAKEMVDKRVGDKENDPNKRSLVGSVFSLCLSLIRFLSLIAVISLFIFMGASIGLHLQSGHKLETIDDIKVALSSSVKSVQNYQQFTKDLVLLIENIVKSVKNWRTTFSATNFGNVENQTKS